MNDKILLVEDNHDFARVLQLHLEKGGYGVVNVADGEAGLAAAISGGYAMIILDVSLPKRDGFSVLQEFRKVDSNTPVLMLTSRNEEIDKVVGFEMGADDYVTKPFSVAELMARIQALLRRSGAGVPVELPQSEDSICVGDLLIDLAKRRVVQRSQELEMTAKEFDLLAFLASHPGQAFSRDEILEQVWEFSGGDYSNTVSTLIMRIRKKIEEDPTQPRLIETVRGYGYRFTDQAVV